MSEWGSPVEIETRRRIKLAVAALAYEYYDTEIMSDAEFDAECLKVDLTIKTGDKQMDKWFQRKFDPSTGQWIRLYPANRIGRIVYIAEHYYGCSKKEDELSLENE